MQVKVTQDEVLEFLDELGDRFPDLLDYEIVNAAREFANKSYIDPIQQEAIAIAYECGPEDARRKLRMWGLSL